MALWRRFGEIQSWSEPPTAENIMKDLGDFRRHRSELANHLIDEYSLGRLNRREFIRRATVLGMSLPLASLLTACSSPESEPSSGDPRQPQTGGTIRTAARFPEDDLNPLTTQSDLGKVNASQVGDFLAWSNENLELEPRIAESWEPNEDASVWTFQIREGVVFHDGSQLSARDVAETFIRLSDPEMQSQALAIFAGILSPDGIRVRDERAVEFSLEGPNGNFPYLVSSDNYSAIVQPAQYPEDWETSFTGTGPWKLERFDRNAGILLRRNDEYWDRDRIPLADRHEIRFFGGIQGEIVALQAGEVDLVVNFPATGGEGLLNDPAINVLELPSAQHPEIHMRTDQEPFQDKRVRQAMALLLDRSALVEGLLNGKGDLGNDSPFAPAYPSTDETVPQREQNIEEAKQLLAAAGKDEGFSVPLYGPRVEEVQDLAVLVQNAGKEAGINLTPQTFDEVTYFDDYWLDSQMGITKYLHRGVPNVYLHSALSSEGPWNAAHFKNEDFDKLVADYTAAVDVGAQRTLARQIGELLLEETPLIIPYFTHNLAAAHESLGGEVRVTATYQCDVTQAGFTT